MNTQLDQLKTLNHNTIIELVGDEPAKIHKFHIEFLKQSSAILRTIIQSFNSDDFSEIKNQAHFLKTSAKAVGAERSAYFLETIESYSLERNKAAIKQVIIKLNGEFKAIKKELTYDQH
ncbi:Hpt domain-containing protein [Pseudoalteromonas obscura]|uniref:Hpt domain-containing protein n=1 Tax=Pseudoalteromonas obscura TaxID=3048491 RepID=A0ABT7ENM1_9GAMM|nr:Hpt domain-containing protein [Pseudoalteromonas sp. P94(2023)]MDK2596651.1 Hpt domain-containing protein [Pseudoalteromonas sp. P94(2023)]